jgi:hypothetical protein
VVVETPPGQEGVSDILDVIFSYGTQTLDRLAFQKALDDIAANEGAGFHSSLDALKEHFSRGVELLADNELHPALPAKAFTVVQQQTVIDVAWPIAESRGLAHDGRDILRLSDFERRKCLSHLRKTCLRGKRLQVDLPPGR